MDPHRRRLIAATALAALMLAGATTACACDQWSSPPAVEVEDCDADDIIERDTDCGFSDADRKTPVPKPTPKKTRR